MATPTTNPPEQQPPVIALEQQSPTPPGPVSIPTTGNERIDRIVRKWFPGGVDMVEIVVAKDMNTKDQSDVIGFNGDMIRYMRGERITLPVPFVDILMQAGRPVMRY